MSNPRTKQEKEAFWSQRYLAKQTGWDIGYPSPPIKEYLNQLSDKTIRILIPGAGNAYEAEYAFRQGFQNVYVLDIAPQPLESLAKRLPDFPKDHLLHEDFFSHQGTYDLILEQTFFCTFSPTKANRLAYAQKMHQLLEPNGKLVGLWFTFPVRPGQSGPPYGGSVLEYQDYFTDFFEIQTFETANNSIKPRLGNEAFAIMKKLD
ncbi:MAG: methyltransferase domain-containing protein [Saprospiraceae bacterium]